MCGLSITDGRVTDKEDEHLEFKSALKGIPGSTWETYSSFANIFGGRIVLGVQDATGTIEGVPHAEQRIQEIWNTVNNPQVISRNILRSDDVKLCDIEGKQIIILEIPRADRFMRPVYYKNLESGTFKRNGDGDYRCTMPEIASMIRDQYASSYDSTVLEGTSFDDIDPDTLHAYRNELRNVQPDHMWNRTDDRDFAKKIGATGHSTECLTAAGLLMFGREESILAYFPRFKLDYMECPANNMFWDYRLVTGDGLWVSNVYNFFSMVRGRIGKEIKRPFAVDSKMHRIEDTDIHRAVREGLVNCIMHADYPGSLVIKIERYPERIIMVNSGLFRIPIETARRGGESDPRNALIARMFSMIGLSERAGTGINYMTYVWEREFGYPVAITEDAATQRTTAEFRFHRQESSDRIDEDILRIMRSDPEASMERIAKELNVSRPTVANHIRRLKSEGIVSRVGGTRGHWECM